MRSTSILPPRSTISAMSIYQLSRTRDGSRLRDGRPHPSVSTERTAKRASRARRPRNAVDVYVSTNFTASIVARAEGSRALSAPWHARTHLQRWRRGGGLERHGTCGAMWPASLAAVAHSAAGARRVREDLLD